MTFFVVWIQIVGQMGLATALPLGGVIAGGKGSIATSGSKTIIVQTTNQLTIDWTSFNIGKNQTVQFVQPNSSSLAINDVIGNTASQILGHLLSNGQVWLLNPNGIFFGKDSVVTTGGFLASTLGSIIQKGSVATFSKGNRTITNAGNILGKYVALIGPNVTNVGGIVGRQVALVGGSDVQVSNLSKEGRLAFVVKQSDVDSLVANSGTITAPGGQILMTAGAESSLMASVVNNTGRLVANTIGSDSGSIQLIAKGTNSTTNVGGTILATSAGVGDGGTIVTNASRVNIAPNAFVSTESAGGQTGTWIIDPNSFYIGMNTGSANSTFGNITNYEDVSPTELETALASNNVIIDSTMGAKGSLGNVYVDAPVSWSSSNSLTLNATNNVNVNASITNSGSGNIKLVADDMAIGGTADVGTVNVASGVSTSTTGTLTVISSATSSDPYTSTLVNPVTGSSYTNTAGSTKFYFWISSANDLTALSGNQSGSALSNNYALNTTIGLSTTTWTPIGNGTTPYLGTFNGNDYYIDGFSVSSSANNVGFFGDIGTSAVVKNLGVTTSSSNVVDTGSGNTGILVGTNQGTVQNVYVNGTVVGGSTTGGIVGLNSGTIGNSISNATVEAGSSSITTWYGGGIAGENTGTIGNSFVGATAGAGGNGTITLATGGTQTFSGIGSIANAYLGGIVGYNTGQIRVSSGSEMSLLNDGTSISYTGGVVGYNTGSAVDTYSTGSVVGEGSTTIEAGGIMGYNNGVLEHSYALGTVTTSGSASTVLSGLAIGYEGSAGSIPTTSYYDSSNSGTAFGSGSNANVVGLTSSQFGTPSNFSGWTFNTWSGNSFTGTGNWTMGDVNVNGYSLSAPILAYAMPTENVTENSVSSVYNGNVVTPGYALSNLVSEANPSISGSTSSANAGFYSVTPVLGTQSAPTLQYDYGSYVVNPGTVLITPQALTMATTATKAYDGTTTLSLSPTNTTFSGIVSGQTGGLGTTVNGQTNSVNVGNNLGGTVSLTNADMTGNSAFTSALSSGDYVLPTTFTGGTITPLHLSLSTTATKNYDGNATIALTPSNTTMSGFLSGQTGALATTVDGQFSSPIVGTNIGGTVSLTGSDFSGNASFLNAVSAGDYVLPTVFFGGTIKADSLFSTSTLAPVSAAVIGSIVQASQPTQFCSGLCNDVKILEGEAVGENGKTQKLHNLKGFRTRRLHKVKGHPFLSIGDEGSRYQY